MAEFEGLIVNREGRTGRIILDRPRALNALTIDMVRGMAATLDAWEADPQIAVVVVTASGDRAFCAGGDIKAIHDAGRSAGNPLARQFWREEYRLDLRIASYSKPIVVFISGLVMGGGAGIAINAQFRVVSSTTRFAMPETGIGLIPDVGASHFLSRMPGETGTYLSLTGASIDAADMLAAGLADAFITQSARADLIDRLNDIAVGKAGFADVEAILAEFHVPQAPSKLAALKDIDTLFAGDSVEAILARLEADGSAWAQATVASMREKSPTSQKLALAALRRGRDLPDLAAALAMEFRVVCRIAEHDDFYEGVRATVVDKDKAPHWQPDRLDQVGEADIAAYFAPLSGTEREL